MSDIRSVYTDKIDFFQNNSPRDLVERYGSPLYVYSERILRKRCRELMSLSRDDKFHVIYSVKANSNPSLLKIIREEGLLADAMSPGELAMDQLAGYKPGELLYISNNNTREEMQNAIASGCLISVDSLSQLETLGRFQPGIRVMVRINPGIGEGHHAKVITGGASSKFGVNPDDLGLMLDILQKHDLTLAGLNQHIGSLFMRPDNYLAAMRVLLDIVDHLPPIFFGQLEILDFGGGFGIPYRKYEHEDRLDMEALGNGLHAIITEWSAKTGYRGRFLVEPGRYVVAECGLLLGRATATKSNAHNHFVGTDLGFNVLMRPMLYDAWHEVEIYAGDTSREPGPELAQTIVGNICESGDILAKNRMLPPIHAGDIIGIIDAGAYGFSMASNYNERLLPAEILLQESGEPRLIRRRQTIADLELCLKDLGQ